MLISGLTEKFHSLGLNIILAVSYLLISKLALNFATLTGNVMPIWPAAGVALAMILLFGYRLWWGVWLGQFATSLLTHEWTLQGLAVSMNAGIGSTLEAVVTAVLINKWIGMGNLLDSVRNIFLFFLFIFIGAIFSATIGVSTLFLYALLNSGFSEVWWTWWLGDGIGMLVFTPFLLAWRPSQFTHRHLNWHIILEVLVLICFLYVVILVIYTYNYPLEYILIGLLVWAVLRFGIQGGTLLIVIITIVTAQGTVYKLGRFAEAHYSQNESLFLLQIFIGMMTIATLTLGAVLRERETAQRKLEQVNLELEQKVIKRTEALQAAEAELRALFAAMTERILVVNDEGRYLKIIDTNNRLAYLPNHLLLGKKMDEIFPTSLARQFMGYIMQVLKTKESLNVEYCLDLLNQDKIWVDATLSLLNEKTVIWVARDITQRKEAEQALKLEQARSEKLLLNILPEKIAVRLKQGEEAIAEYFEEVTILFADIVGFTPLSAKLPAIELVNVLNQLFSAFDKLVDKYNLEKIKTVGDAYMVVGGLPEPRSDHAEAIAALALEMQYFIGNFEVNHSHQFAIRIGINTGPVVSGVIGMKKFIYDLWGDTVNVASRMESSGEAGKIQITLATYQKIAHLFMVQYRGEVKIKGKGEMPTYWLEGYKTK